MDSGVSVPLTCDDVRDLAAGFVVEALEPGEMASVRQHLATCADAHAEFDSLGGVVPYLAESLAPVEPPARLRGRILDAVAAAATAGDAAQRAGAVVEIGSAPSLQARLGLGASGPRPVWAALGIAAVLAVVVLGSWNLQLQSTNQDLASYQRGVAVVLDAAARPGSQLAVLAATPGSPVAGLGAVRADGTVAIAMRGLAPTNGAQVYEAWIVAGPSAPIPIGSFQVGSTGSGAMTAAASAPAPGAVIALTLEPGPGATTPTMPLIASGVAQPVQG